MQIYALKKGDRRPRVGRDWIASSSPVAPLDTLTVNADFAAFVDSRKKLRTVARWEHVQHVIRNTVYQQLLQHLMQHLLCSTKDAAGPRVTAARAALHRGLVRGQLWRGAVKDLLTEEGLKLVDTLAHTPWAQAVDSARSWLPLDPRITERGLSIWCGLLFDSEVTRDARRLRKDG